MTHRTQKMPWHYVLVLLVFCHYPSLGQEETPTISEKAFEKGMEFKNAGDAAQAMIHFRTALQSIDTTIPDIYWKRYEILNEMGTAKQRLFELDSSSGYFKRALSQLNQTERTPKNEFYLSGILKNRIGLNQFNTGKMQASIQSMKEAVASFRQYAEAAPSEEEKLDGLKKQYASVDNLGGFYRGIGENERGLDLAEYSYQQKLSFLDEDDPNITISRLILGHINLLARNHQAAGEYLDQALEHIDQVPYAHTYGLMVRASTYENVDDFENAERTYRECETLYREGANGTYSLVFLDALVEMSRFYAKIGDMDKAIALAQEGYEFTQSDAFSNDLIAFYHIQNMAQVHFMLKQYEEAKKYSEEALNYFSNERIVAQTQLDSIRNEIRKPSALYLKAKSTYYLTNPREKQTLQSLLQQAQEGLSILERQKTNVGTQDDLATLLTDNNDLINFTKLLYWDLYQLTKEDSHMDELISLHESAIYTRIRSRLNLKDMAYANIPKTVLDREGQLREALTTALDGSGTIDAFFSAQSKWASFLDSLRARYPDYHTMRYATIREPIKGIQERIDPEVTIVRYLFMEENLFAFVLNNTSKEFIPIDGTEVLSDLIQTVNDPTSDFRTVSTSLLQLYDLLWEPIAQFANTENIVLIPDGVLFNLSFDVLTPSKIESYPELAQNSLLAKHNLSYNYSLFLAGGNNENTVQQKNYVSFAPEFTSDMKTLYRQSVTDSVDLDQGYLSLLPQPFSVETVKRLAQRFNGITYLNTASTKRAFTENAKNHKIIHLATHAESNNLNPELSRLIFAKDMKDSVSNNYLHTYEIYNHDLGSQLTILTACETGKPSFQPGEGMISLAHAFNYAGSESILTSLWKIDEQSSTEIVSGFYDNLAQGWSKDQALRNAKLQYLANAQGRTQAPFYWSGLVLMGETQAIQLQSGFSIWVWMGIIITGLLVIWGWSHRKKKAA